MIDLPVLPPSCISPSHPFAKRPLRAGLGSAQREESGRRAGSPGRWGLRKQGRRCLVGAARLSCAPRVNGSSIPGPGAGTRGGGTSPPTGNHLTPVGPARRGQGGSGKGPKGRVRPEGVRCPLGGLSRALGLRRGAAKAALHFGAAAAEPGVCWVGTGPRARAPVPAPSCPRASARPGRPNHAVLPASEGQQPSQCEEGPAQRPGRQPDFPR